MTGTSNCTSAASGEAVLHYKPFRNPRGNTAILPSLQVGAYGEPAESRTILNNAIRNSPIHPDWVVFRFPVDQRGAAVVPFVQASSSRMKDDQPPGSESWIIPTPGTYVLADKELTRWGDSETTAMDQFGALLPSQSLKNRHALFFDIDGTIRGENKLQEIVRAWQRTLALNGAILCLNTGRSIPSVLDWITEINRVVVPTATICRLGTEIAWFRNHNGWSDKHIMDTAWASLLDNAHGWQYKKVIDLVREPLESHSRVKGRLCTPVTRLDPPPDYITYVLTFNVRRAYATEATRVVRESLGDQVKVKIAVSGEDKDEQYMDVINADAGKLGGLRHVCKELGDEFAPERCVMAGDSGNDLDALEHDGPEKAIVVNNCQVELKSFWQRLNDDKPGQTRVVKTKKNCAAGVVEGLQSLGFL